MIARRLLAAAAAVIASIVFHPHDPAQAQNIAVVSQQGTCPPARATPYPNGSPINSLFVPLTVDANGILCTNASGGGGGGGGTSSSFSAAFPATGTAVGMSQGGLMVPLTGTSNNLNVQCANCSGSGVSTADQATFTAGASLFAGGGGFFQTTATLNPLNTGQQGLFQVTANRALFINLRNASGAELGVAAAPLQVSLANTGANATALLVTGTGGTFPVTGTVTANAGSNLNTSLLALESGGNLASLVTQLGAVTASPTANTIGDRLKVINTTLGSPFQAGGSIGNTTFAVTQATGTNLHMVVDSGTVTAVSTVTNLAQMNGAALLMGNGVTGTGSQRVTIASDNTAFAVNSTLSAETTKVIGTVRVASGGVASGAFAAGALAIGAGVDGWNATMGTIGDTAWSGSGNGTEIAVLKKISTDILAGAGPTGATAPTSAIEVGCIAQSAEAAAITGGQLGGAACDLVKKLITLPYANPENALNGQITSAMTGTSSTALTGMGAQGSGVRVYATACTFSNSHATVGTMILLQDGSGGSTLWQAPAAPAFGGAVVQFPTPIKTTANTGLFAVNGTTGSSTFVSCTGYKGI